MWFQWREEKWETTIRSSKQQITSIASRMKMDSWLLLTFVRSPPTKDRGRSRKLEGIRNIGSTHTHFRCVDQQFRSEDEVGWIHPPNEFQRISWNRKRDPRNWRRNEGIWREEETIRRRDRGRRDLNSQREWDGKEYSLLWISGFLSFFSFSELIIWYYFYPSP